MVSLWTRIRSKHKIIAKDLEVSRKLPIFAAVIIKPRIVMETTEKRTREEVRAAFRAFMRERDEEQKAAQVRSLLYHPERLAETV